MQNKGFFVRLVDLWRGFWGTKLDSAEARNAEAVYQRAIAERSGQHLKLKDAVGRLVYLRNRIEADLQQRSDDLKLVDGALHAATQADDDLRALALIRKKRTLVADVERLQEELGRLRVQADSAKEGLLEVARAIKQLKDERAEMLARKTHAVARMEVASVLQQSSSDFAVTDQALENVREAIVRLEHQADLGTEEDFHATGEISISQLRREAADDRDLEELRILKEQFGKALALEAPSASIETISAIVDAPQAAGAQS